jgi:Raf kinase inhibitor-like YbhB/YbcL family protein
MRALTFIPLLIAAPAVADSPTPNTPTTLTVTSTAFKGGEAIPADFTCDGANTSPPLTWSTVPAKTKSVAVLMEDVDAPGGIKAHWIITGLAPNDTALEQGALPNGAQAAKNDNGKIGYSGPCPQAGRHNYQFYVYALDATVPQAASRLDFLHAIKGHVLAIGELTGTYQKATPTVR